MSLDISLTLMEPLDPIKVAPKTGVFVRDNGQTRELTLAEVKKKWPDFVMPDPEERASYEVYEANITHNLGRMADEAGIYYALWRPEEKDWYVAADIIVPLEDGLIKLKENPERFKTFNPNNGWGSYEGFVEFVEGYLAACRQYPSAKIEVSR